MIGMRLLALSALVLAHGPHQAFLDAALVRAAGGPDLAAARSLLAWGASANARTTDGRSTPALNEAVEVGSPALVRLLLAHGADVGAKDSEGNTPLSEAALDIGDGKIERADGLPIVQALLAHGADPAAKNSYGYSPIRLADERGADWVVSLLRRAAQKRAAQKKGGR